MGFVISFFWLKRERLKQWFFCVKKQGYFLLYMETRSSVLCNVTFKVSYFISRTVFVLVSTTLSSLK